MRAQRAEDLLCRPMIRVAGTAGIRHSDERCVFVRCRFAIATLALALASCDSSTSFVDVQPPTPVPAVVKPVTSVRLSVDTIGLIVGETRQAAVLAFDQSGAFISSDAAGLTSSNTSVVEIGDGTIIPVQDGRTGRTWRELGVVFRFMAPGTATVRATLNDASDSVVLVVRPRPPASKSLVVDSFSVVEYRAQCAWACPYLVYAPLLKLRESTGRTTVEVVSVEFALGGRSTGVCRGSAFYTPGLSAHLNMIADYLWSNDLIFVSLDGQPFSETVATARVIVREAGGAYYQVDATGPVQRMVSNPVLPTSQSGDSGWMCSG